MFASDGPTDARPAEETEMSARFIVGDQSSFFRNQGILDFSAPVCVIHMAV